MEDDMKRKKRKPKDEQPYKVGKPFVKWLESQINVMEKGRYIWNRWDKLENEINLEAYRFIQGIVKP